MTTPYPNGRLGTSEDGLTAHAAIPGTKPGAGFLAFSEALRPRPAAHRLIVLRAPLTGQLQTECRNKIYLFCHNIINL